MSKKIEDISPSEMEKIEREAYRAAKALLQECTLFGSVGHGDIALGGGVIKTKEDAIKFAQTFRPKIILKKGKR